MYCTWDHLNEYRKSNAFSSFPIIFFVFLLFSSLAIVCCMLVQWKPIGQLKIKAAHTRFWHFSEHAKPAFVAIIFVLNQPDRNKTAKKKQHNIIVNVFWITRRNFKRQWFIWVRGNAAAADNVVIVAVCVFFFSLSSWGTNYRFSSSIAQNDLTSVETQPNHQINNHYEGSAAFDCVFYAIALGWKCRIGCCGESTAIKWR